MPKYGVNIPLIGYIYLEVEAGNEEDAIEAAFDKPWDDNDVVELETVHEVSHGNVCHASCSEACATLLKEGE